MSNEAGDVRVGTTVAGYTLVRLIGRGGMGVVYLAEHETLKRRAALKLVAPELAADVAFRARFLREARTAAGLDHRNVVGVYDAGEVDGQLYLAMQLVDGTDLARLIQAEGRLAPRRVASITADVAAALDVAHASGIVHRDVKPANVLLDAERAYLGDFGLTTFGGATDAGLAATRVGELVGTSHYLSPEAIQGETLDGRADLYGLACVVFHALTGQAPFPRANEMAVLYAHVHEPPPSVSAQRPGLPAELDAVLARALAKQPGDRWATGREFAAALAAVAPAELEDGPSPVPVAIPATGDSSSKVTRVRPAAPQGPVALLAGLGASTTALTRMALGGRWTVVEASDRDSAALKAREQPPDLVFVTSESTLAPADLVVRALRDDPATRDAHVVLLARGRPGPRELAATGADDALAVPFSPLQLQVKLRRIGTSESA